MNRITCSLAAIAFAAASAQAQDVGPPPPDPAVPADAAPGEPAAPAPSAQPAPPGDVAVEVSDAEVDSFAQATVKLQDIADDSTLDGDTKQQQMVAVVTEVGLNPERYTEIGQASATDTELRARIQTAMAKYGGPGEG